MESPEFYVKYTFRSDWDNDMMLALLTRLPFESFEETDNGLVGYLPSEIANDEMEISIREFAQTYDIYVDRSFVENKNWNQEWEESFMPVSIDDFCIIKSDFHNIDPTTHRHSITINPKMTFGTGHHETTVMMIRLMSEITIIDHAVLDYGSGTGILSILAEMMGARDIVAIDNDQEAVDNIMDNATINNCHRIRAVLSEKPEAQKYSIDLLLANIDRNVLAANVEEISGLLHKGGMLLISGIMIADREMIINLYEKHSLKLMKSLEQGDWCAMKFIAY